MTPFTRTAANRLLGVALIWFALNAAALALVLNGQAMAGALLILLEVFAVPTMIWVSFNDLRAAWYGREPDMERDWLPPLRTVSKAFLAFAYVSFFAIVGWYATIGPGLRW